ncbi:uncharacterized protein [Coffea arabica]
MCWFGNRALPFAILVAATGAAIQKAIKSFGGQGRAIVLQEKHEQDFVHKADDGLANEDSISRLPDDLLSDVLSRLDLIEAVGTRILSRRWKNVCKFSLCVPKLEDARITFTGNGSIPYFFGEVLKDCPKLKNLLFQTHTDKLKYTPGKMDMFSNLRTLYFVPGMRSPPDLLNVVPILEACPHLEEFRLQLLCRGFNEERGREWPPRRLGQLKEVEFNGFHGTVNEIHFATYLVKNAPALERLWIRSPYRFYCDDYHLETGGGWYMDERVDTLHEELMMQAVSSKLQVDIVRSPRTELKICGRE